jgi:hypothetical protein
MSYTAPHKTLAVASSRSNSEALAVHVVLAHSASTQSCAAFQPYMCGLHRGAPVVTAALIGYDDMKVAAGMTMRGRL